MNQRIALNVSRRLCEGIMKSSRVTYSTLPIVLAHTPYFKSYVPIGTATRYGLDEGKRITDVD